LKQLARTVRKENWEKAKEALEANFAEGGREEVVSQVLALVCTESTSSAIKWVEHLDAQLQPGACNTLYGHIKKGGTDQLLLLKYVRKLSIDVDEDVRCQLEVEARNIIDQLVLQIKENVITLVTGLDDIVFFVPNIVKRFDPSYEENIQLLLQWSHKCLGKSDKVCLKGIEIKNRGKVAISEVFCILFSV
jgi:hypothetical protein